MEARVRDAAKSIYEALYGRGGNLTECYNRILQGLREEVPRQRDRDPPLPDDFEEAMLEPIRVLIRDTWAHVPGTLIALPPETRTGDFHDESTDFEDVENDVRTMAPMISPGATQAAHIVEGKLSSSSV